MKRIFLTTLLLMVVIGNLLADDVTFIASAPKSVVLNQHFRLTYTVNTTDAKEPKIADLVDFEILSGPNISTKRNFSYVNGKSKATEEVTFTYILMPRQEGTFTIPPAKASVKGKEIASNSITIKVLPEDKASQASQGSGNRSRAQGSTSRSIGSDDLFVRAILSKSKVYEQEAVLLTYKVYTAVNLTNLNFPTPELKGFNIQEIELPQDRQFELDNYNGRNYNTLVWRQFVLFPQESGKLSIPSLDFEATVAIQESRSMDPFEMMFNGFGGYVEVKKKLQTNAQELTVEKLPIDRPAAYSGGVGQFSIESKISDTRLKTDSEFTLKVIIKGTGNLKLLGNPQLDLPAEFESYDPVIENKFSLKAKGFTGEKIYEYLITPKASGTYTIPAARMTFFNTLTGKYDTIETEPYTVEVEKNNDPLVTAVATTQVNKKKGELLTTDIRHIKYDDSTATDGKETFFASSTYILFYIVPSVCVLLFLVIYRKKVAENANTSLVRTKKANKVATKRLKSAKILMKENNVNGFYDEILKAMWGYTSDKLSIPVSQLSKDNIANTLLARGVAQDTVAEFQKILNEGEFARYAPGDKEATMEKVYAMTIDVISKMENSIK